MAVAFICGDCHPCGTASLVFLLSEAAELGFSVRYLSYSEGRGVYRITFHIQEDEQNVHAMRIQHGWCDAISVGDVDSRA